MDFLKDVLGIGQKAFDTVINWKANKKGKSLKEQFSNRDNLDNYNVFSQLSKGNVKTGIQPLDELGKVAGKIVDPISDLAIKAGKGLGTAFIQTPVLGATQGKVNIPFSTEEDLAETSGDDLLERVVGSGKWAFKNVSEPLFNLATIAKKPATAAASATIGAAGQMLQNKANDKPIFNDLDKGAEQGLNNAYILAITNGVTNSILGKIPGGGTFLEGSLSKGWQAAREGGKLLSAETAKMAAKQLARGLIETPAETIGFASWDTIKNDKEFSQALEDNFYSALLGNTIFHSGASAAQISPLLAKNVMQVLKTTLKDSKFDIPKIDLGAGTDAGKNVQNSQNTPVLDTTKGKVPSVDEILSKTPGYRKPNVSTKFYKSDIADFDQARDVLKNKQATQEELTQAQKTIDTLAENYLSKPEQVKIGGDYNKLLGSLAKKFTKAETTQPLYAAAGGFGIDENGNFEYDPERGAAAVALVAGAKSKTGKQIAGQAIDTIRKTTGVDDLIAKAKGTDLPFEKQGRNLMEWENADLNPKELAKKLEIAKEGNEDPALIKLIEDDLRAVKGSEPMAPPPVPELKPMKQRGFTETVMNTPGTPKKILKNLDDPINYYGKVTNEETVRNVKENILTKGDEYALKIAKSPDDPNNNATAMLMLDKYLKNNEFEKFTSLMNEVNPRFTEQGQQIQILSLYGRLTPTGAVKYTQKIIDEANKSLPPKRQLKLEDATIKDIKQLAENIGKTENGTREHQIAVAKLLDRVASEVPVSLGQKVATIQTMAQLLNPKTLIRNTVGNAGFAGLENTKDVLATGIDKMVSNITGVRTKVLPSLPTQAKGASEGFKLGLEDALLGVDTSKGLTTQFDLPNRTFREGFLGQAEKVLNISLRATDRAAYTAAFDESVRQQMKAANVAEPTEKMLATAHADGLYRTFQDESKLAQVFKGVKKILNKVGTSDGKFGLGDLILKYPRTPANLLARGIDYSPAGFVKAAADIYKPLVQGTEFEQRQFVENLSRAVTGSGLIGLGYVLADAGIVTGKPEKDQDIRATQRASGEGGFKFNIDAFKRWFTSGFDKEKGSPQEGDTLVSYDWFQPQSFTFSMGVNAAKGSKDAKDYIASIADGLNAGVQTLVEQPLVTGVTRFAGTTNLKGAASAFIEAFANAPASFVPSIANQVGQLIDNKSRETYDPNPIVENLINRTKARIPGVRQDLPERIDVFGKPMETYQDGSNNIFNVFFNPAFVSKIKRNPEAEEVLRIFENSGLTNQAPQIAGEGSSQKVTINGEKIDIPADKLGEYQTYLGEKTQIAFANLMAQPKWKTMTDEEKANAMSSAMENINSAAKIEIFGNKPKNVSKDVKRIMAGGLYAGSIDETTRDTGEGGGVVSDADTQTLIDTFELNKFVGSKETGVAKIKLDKEKVSAAVDILNGKEEYADLTDEQKVNLIESMDLAVADVQYDAMAKEDTDIKLAMISEQNMDHDQLLSALQEGRKKSISGEIFATDKVLDELYYEGLITSSERAALKKLDYNSKGELRAGAGSGSGTSKTDKTIASLIKEAAEGAPEGKSTDELIKDLKKGEKQYAVPKGGVDANLTTAASTAKRLAAQVPKPEELIKRAKAVASASTSEARRVNDKLRGGGAPGRTALTIRTGGRRA